MATVAFVVVRVLPGDVAQLIVGTEGDPAAAGRIRAQLGLDRPLAVQYAGWLAAALRGDLGVSLRYDRPVAALIAGRLQVTLALAVLAATLATLAAVPLGVYAAVRRDRAGDLLASGLTQLGIAVPSFWVGLLLILAFAVHWPLFPAAGFTPWSESPWRALRSLALPAVALALPRVAVLGRLVRSSLLDVLGHDYVRTARAKGLHARAVLYRHALKNALIPPLTVLGLQVGQLLGGSIVVESVFALPGLGQLLLRGIAARDLPVVQGAAVFIAGAVVIANFLVDLGYMVLDPRIRY